MPAVGGADGARWKRLLVHRTRRHDPHGANAARATGSFARQCADVVRLDPARAPESLTRPLGRVKGASNWAKLIRVGVRLPSIRFVRNPGTPDLPRVNSCRR